MSIHVKNECYSFNFFALMVDFLFVFCFLSFGLYILGVNSSLLLLSASVYECDLSLKDSVYCLNWIIQSLHKQKKNKNILNVIFSPSFHCLFPIVSVCERIKLW